MLIFGHIFLGGSCCSDDLAAAHYQMAHTVPVYPTIAIKKYIILSKNSSVQGVEKKSKKRLFYLQYQEKSWHKDITFIRKTKCLFVLAVFIIWSHALLKQVHSLCVDSWPVLSVPDFSPKF